MIVSSLAGATEAYLRHRPARVISLLSEDEAPPPFAGLAPCGHLVLYVAHESCAATISRAARERARDIIDFAKGWDGAGDILIHCNRGVARSTAAAFIILCIREPQTPEAALMKRLRAAAPHADPCPLFVSYADDILGRNGRMADALDETCPPCAAMPAPTAVVKVAA
ncbi:MAG: tyrosine phosphatase family protein [Parvularculaceae bacterium]